MVNDCRSQVAPEAVDARGLRTLARPDRVRDGGEKA
jgi:hypothetical protein